MTPAEYINQEFPNATPEEKIRLETAATGYAAQVLHDIGKNYSHCVSVKFNVDGAGKILPA